MTPQKSSSSWAVVTNIWPYRTTTTTDPTPSQSQKRQIVSGSISIDKIFTFFIYWKIMQISIQIVRETNWMNIPIQWINGSNISTQSETTDGVSGIHRGIYRLVQREMMNKGARVCVNLPRCCHRLGQVPRRVIYYQIYWLDMKITSSSTCAHSIFKLALPPSSLQIKSHRGDLMSLENPLCFHVTPIDG